MSPASPDNLILRAQMLKEARNFFDNKGLIEVDCPIITRQASVDPHIDLIPVLDRYLHSSPEYGMKRLLARGVKDPYQISHVFRSEEVGSLHNPEFTLAEWYRIGFSFEEMIKETLQFIQLFTHDENYSEISYRHAFITYTGLDYVKSCSKDLITFIKENNIPHYQGIEKEGKDALLNLILAEVIEPKLGMEHPLVLTHYPASQAALAEKIQVNDEETALRFEVYVNGIELANGYQELIDPIEQRKRLEEANQLRVALKKEPLPIDESFLSALEQGVPKCSGVAVGFDRLMMLKCKASHIQEVIPFCWSSA